MPCFWAARKSIKIIKATTLLFAAAKKERMDAMKTATLTALKAIYESDPVRNRSDREVLIKLFGLDVVGDVRKPLDRVLSFSDAAARLHRTTRTVHLLVRRGVLRKARMPGSQRACGVLASDFDKFLESMVFDPASVG